MFNDRSEIRDSDVCCMAAMADCLERRLSQVGSSKTRIEVIVPLVGMELFARLRPFDLGYSHGINRFVELFVSRRMYR